MYQFSLINTKDNFEKHVFYDNFLKNIKPVNKAKYVPAKL